MKLIRCVLQWFRRRPAVDAPTLTDQHDFWWAERKRCEEMTVAALRAGDYRGAVRWWGSHNACIHGINRDVRMEVGMAPLQVRKLSEVIR